MTNIDRKRANNKRSKKLTYLKAENQKLKREIENYIKKTTVDTETMILVYKLLKSLNYCSNLSLYAHSGNDIQLITSITCNHKICNICNWNRQKKIRRKYFRWFAENETLNVVAKGDTRKMITNSQLNKYEEKGYEILNTSVKYDLMHLTLTVPHSENGWKGKIFYFDEIKRAFNFMRKTSEWLEWVYGGEYGVESTKNNEGYHIHIHSLLFVKRGTQNRNHLHKEILRIWNRLTVDQNNNRQPFTDNQVEAIKKGNKLIDDEFIYHLKPSGSTIINLETIYTIGEDGKKRRSPQWNSEEMIRAVLETISYHFTPKMFSLSENSHDIESIINILQPVYGQILYFKFGCLHGEKSLNIKDDSLLEDYDESNEIIDEETGEILERQFFVTNPLNLYNKGNDDKIELKRIAQDRIKLLRTHTGRGAVEQLISLAMEKNTNEVKTNSFKNINTWN